MSSQAPAPLSMATFQRFMAEDQARARAAAEESAQRDRRWHELRLDWDAMSPLEVELRGVWEGALVEHLVSGREVGGPGVRLPGGGGEAG